MPLSAMSALEKNGHHGVCYVIQAGIRFSELFFGIDLHQSQVAKAGMSALH